MCKWCDGASGKPEPVDVEVCLSLHFTPAKWETIRNYLQDLRPHFERIVGNYAPLCDSALLDWCIFTAHKAYKEQTKGESE